MEALTTTKLADEINRLHNGIMAAARTTVAEGAVLIRESDFQRWMADRPQR
jgi:hypothetical protein